MKKIAVMYFLAALIIEFAAVSYFGGSMAFFHVPQSSVRMGETLSSSRNQPAISIASGTDPASAAPISTSPQKQSTASSSGKKKTNPTVREAPPPQSASSVPQVDLQGKSFVGLLCHFGANTAAIANAYGNSSGEILMKGSGVIVNSEGYILTVRHLVDPKWTNWAYASSTSDSMKILNNNITFKYCEVAMPTSDALPDIAVIQRINPNITVNHPFLYLATLAFVPPQGSLSDYEYGYLDFAVLKVTEPMHNCAQFNACTLPRSYPYSPSLSAEVPEKGTNILNFGYPAELINSRASTFNDFYLKGTLGYLKDYFGGDAYFKNKPFTFEWTANDVLEGRSGSPLMWKGYIVGIQTSTNIENSAEDFALGIPAIQRILKENNLGDILITN